MVDSPHYSNDNRTIAEEEILVSNSRIINLGPNQPRNLTEVMQALEQTPAKIGHLDYRILNRAYSHTPGPTPLSPSVCSVCQTIPFDLLPSESDAALPHHTWEDLNSSATSCPLCRVVLWAAKKLREVIIGEVEKAEGCRYLWSGRFISGSVPEIEPQTRVYLFASWWRGKAELPNHLLMGLGVRLGLDLCKVDLRELGIDLDLDNLGIDLGKFMGPDGADGRRQDLVPIRGSSVRICTDFEDPISSLVHGRLRQMDMGSSASHGLLKRWLNACLQKHDCIPKDTPLPDRVLELYHSQSCVNIRLVETSNQVGRYIALSHCWGTTPTIRTLTSNIDNFKKNISFDTLPKTFQDAVTITTELAISYLWIDSLCIIQDSEDDWMEQSTQMANIYSNAWLTISASASTSSQSGCFVPHLAVYNTPEANRYGLRDTRPEATATAIVRLSDGTASKLYFFPEETPTGGIYSVNLIVSPLQYDPLCSRAWTLQEHVLSPRTVHYGVDQMYWECLCDFYGEDGMRTPAIVPRIKATTSWDWDDKLAGIWHSIVCSYSKRKLSRGSDKLPALSGVASRIAQAVDDTYYAGIWRNRLWSDLLWRVTPTMEWIALGITYKEDWESHRDEIKERDPNPATDPILIEQHDWLSTVVPNCPLLPEIPALQNLRSAISITHETKVPDMYRAPSWSFASLDASVSYLKSNLRVLASCEDIQVQLLGSTAFGHVSGGWLTLKAPLIQLLQSRPGAKTPVHGTGAFAKFPDPLAEESCEVVAYFDLQPEFPCSALLIDEDNALLLRPKAEGKGKGKVETWQRIGVAELNEFRLVSHPRIKWDSEAAQSLFTTVTIE